MRIKRVFVLCMILAGVLLICSACGNGQANVNAQTTAANENKADTANAAETATAEKEDEKAAETSGAAAVTTSTMAASTTTKAASEGSGEKGEYWLTDEKVSYSYLINTVTDLNQFPFYQHLEEITNVHIDWICMSGDNYQPYVNLMWASGDIPDLMRGLTGTDFATYAAQGQFFPINSIWRENMPNLMEIIRQHPEIETRLQMPDGNVYAFTGVQGGVIQATCGVWIYQPWLDKLGLPVPTEIEEFFDVLTSFKEQDPNGNGQQDEIPFALVPTAGWRQGQVHGWFGCSQDWLIQDGVVSYSPYTENWKSYVKFMNRLWNAKLMDQEAFTQDSATFGAKAQQDPVIYGVIMDYGKYIAVPASEYENYTLLGPMQTGTTPSGLLNSRGDKDYQLWGLVAPKADIKNPEIVLKWADVLYDPYYGAQALFGMDGVHIQKNADGIFEYITEIPAPYQTREEWFMGTHYNQMLDYSATELCSLLTSENQNIMEMREIREKFGDTFINEPLPALTLQTREEADKLSSYPDINKLRDDMTPQWMAGERDVETDWENFKKQLEQLGVTDYIAAYQEYYTRIAKQLGD